MEAIEPKKAPSDAGLSEAEARWHRAQSGFNEHLSLLVSAGDSIAGDRHTLWYFGLYERW